MSGRRLALVVATDRYDDATLHGLASPAADAEALADVLGDPDLGGFEIDVLRNPTSWETAQHIETLLSERHPADLVLLHFSCHGLKDESGELFLATRNTSPTRLASTAVDSSLVNRLVQRSRAQRVVLLLDCCYGGAFERGVVARAGSSMHVGDQFSQGQLAAGRGRVVITASSAMEYALEGTDLTVGGAPKPSLFTGALVTGLSSGEADRDQDGHVGLDELYDYVFEKVQEASPHQTPSKWEFGLQGDLVIARNPRRQIRPDPVPEDISDLVHHPTAGVRLGAIDELARIAAQTNVQRGAGAVLLLRQLLDDDSRRVSQAAATELNRILPSVSPSSVDFGHIKVGGTSFTEVLIEGGPLALASTVEASRADLQARLEGSVLHVGATGATPGRLEGWVSLKGPAGERRIGVTATVTADVDHERPGVPAPPHEPPAPSVPPVPPAPEPRTPEPPHPHPHPNVPRYALGALVVLLLVVGLVAWLALRDGDQPNNQAAPQPFTSSTLYNVASPYFAADDCIIPDASQAPLASGLPHTELVKCASTDGRFTGTFWCNENTQDLEQARDAFLGKAVDGTMQDIDGTGAGTDAATDGVQVSFQHIQSGDARVYWDSPSRLCSAEIQAADADVAATVDFWRNGAST